MHVRSIVHALTVAAVVAAVAPASAGTASNQPERAPAFTLRDQYGAAMTYRFPKTKISVLTFGDLKGSTQIEGWVRPLYDRYTSRVDIHGVAVLDLVPSFAREFTRNRFKDWVTFPVLLDFEGTVAQRYRFKSDNANIVVIAPNGAIALRVVGEATDAKLKRVYAEIDRLLRT